MLRLGGQVPVPAMTVPAVPAKLRARRAATPGVEAAAVRLSRKRSGAGTLEGITTGALA